jgi:hypothetical protein
LSSGPGKEILITNLAGGTAEGTNRISAQVDEEELWFECNEQELIPSPEAFTGVSLLPAMAAGADIRIDGALADDWLANMDELMSIYQEWWDYPKIEILCDKRPPGKPPEPEQTVLNFSAGADAFYSLLKGEEEINALVTIDGMLAGRRTPAREQTFRQRFGSIAREKEMDFYLVRTNAGDHPLFSSMDILDTHGSILAAMGRILPGVDQLIVSSSNPLGREDAFGSHWKTDYLWGNTELKINYLGSNLIRSQKVVELADEPLVRKHLNVCFSPGDELVNCCRCEKCIRTMLCLESVDKLEGFPAFHSNGHLLKRLGELPPLDPALPFEYECILDMGCRPELDRAIIKFLRRSRIRNSSIYRALRKFELKTRKALSFNRSSSD